MEDVETEVSVSKPEENSDLLDAEEDSQDSDPEYEYDYFNFWASDNFDSNEPRVKLTSDPSLTKLEIDSWEYYPEFREEMEFWHLKELTLTPEEMRKVIELLNQDQDVFSKNEYDLGRFPRWKHVIDTGDNPPIRNKPRKLSHAKLEALKIILANLEKTN